MVRQGQTGSSQSHIPPRKDCSVPVNIDYDVNDTVSVVNGPLEGFIGTVQEINKEKQKVKVLVSMFGRETPVELEFSQVQKVN